MAGRKPTTRIADPRLRRVYGILSEAGIIERRIAVSVLRLNILRENKKRLSGEWALCPELAASEGILLLQLRLLWQARRRIVDAIQAVPESRQRTVLEMHYLEGLPFFVIAMRLNYSERQISRLHMDGLRTLSMLRGEWEDGGNTDGDYDGAAGCTFP